MVKLPWLCNWEGALLFYHVANAKHRQKRNFLQFSPMLMFRNCLAHLTKPSWDFAYLVGKMECKLSLPGPKCLSEQWYWRRKSLQNENGGPRLHTICLPTGMSQEVRING